MKRFHIHLSVTNLQDNIRFYTQLFGAEPTRVEADYAKWMLDDPHVNFAISTRSGARGLDHLGFQVDSDSELQDMKQRAQAADMAMIDEGETTCCYAASDKYWITDPQGIAWEQFHTLGNIPVFSGKQAADAGACCAPTSAPAEQADNACCAPSTTGPDATTASACCAPASPQPVAVAMPGKKLSIPVKGHCG